MVKVGRPRSNGYEEFGFNLIKEKNKFVAKCKICKRTLQNTAFIRLRGHRNICKPPSAVDIPQCSMFVPDDEIFCIPNENEFGFSDASPQVSSDGLMNGQSMILQNSCAVGDDGGNLQDTKCTPNYKKIAVLNEIKKNKHELFEDPKADKSEIWIKVLQKAQLLGLAPEDSHWTFARDSLYGMWKNRTLAKKVILQSDGWNANLDVVDFAILQILGRNPPGSIDFSDYNSDYSLEEHQQSAAIHEGNSNKKPKYTSDSIVGDDGGNLQDTKCTPNYKKIAVLNEIKKNKHELFEDPKADKSEIWIKVLQKAQLLGLAPEDSHWTFARDSLYGMWKNRTLAKKVILQSDGWNAKLDVVDLAILQILGKNPPGSIDFSDHNSDYSLEEYQQSAAIHEGNPNKKPKYTSDSILDQKRKTRSTQISDELQEAELRIKRLKCEVLEIEVVKQRLQVLQLERELKLPPSACTGKLFTGVIETPTDKKSISGETDAATINSETEG